MLAIATVLAAGTDIVVGECHCFYELPGRIEIEKLALRGAPPSAMLFYRLKWPIC